MQRILFFLIAIAISWTNLVYADRQSDELACQNTFDSLYNQVTQKILNKIHDQVVDVLIRRYRQAGIQIDRNNIEAGLHDSGNKGNGSNFSYMWVTVLASVAAGKDSAEFRATGSTTASLLVKALRETIYDPLGRVVSTKLTCSLNPTVPWKTLIVNHATDGTLEELNNRDGLSAEVVLP